MQKQTTLNTLQKKPRQKSPTLQELLQQGDK